jgi:hypothetical protein
MPATEALLQAVIKYSAVGPALWRIEVANSLQ